MSDFFRDGSMGHLKDAVSGATLDAVRGYAKHVKLSLSADCASWTIKGVLDRMLKFQTTQWWNLNGNHGGARTDLKPPSADSPFHRMAAELIFGQVRKLESTSAPAASPTVTSMEAADVAGGVAGTTRERIDVPRQLQELTAILLKSEMEAKTSIERAKRLAVGGNLDSKAARIAARRQESHRNRREGGAGGVGGAGSASASQTLETLAEDRRGEPAKQALKDDGASAASSSSPVDAHSSRVDSANDAAGPSTPSPASEELVKILRAEGMLPRGREIASASDAEAKVQSLCAEKGLRDLDELFGASDAERTGKLTALGMGLLDSITQALDLKTFERQRLESGVVGAFDKKYPFRAGVKQVAAFLQPLKEPLGVIKDAASMAGGEGGGS